MSTEFYCEEFPAEQNGKPVQTLKDLLEACPEDRFHFMTPFGYVDLTAQDAGQLRQGAAIHDLDVHLCPSSMPRRRSFQRFGRPDLSQPRVL